MLMKKSALMLMLGITILENDAMTQMDIGQSNEVGDIMEYNIDILVAGCNTTCMHCYVNGGKAPIMDLDDFYVCINKLGSVFDKLKESIGFTLDNELFNHPNALEILECVEKTCKNNYFHHGSTTGIAFLNHPKQQELFNVLKRNNWQMI